MYDRCALTISMPSQKHTRNQVVDNDACHVLHELRYCTCSAKTQLWIRRAQDTTTRESRRHDQNSQVNQTQTFVHFHHNNPALSSQAFHATISPYTSRLACRFGLTS